MRPLASVRNNADQIQREMAKIRSALHQDMREVVGGASSATDWRSYLRKYPWLAIGGAFAAGYLVVPRRSRPMVTVVAPVVGSAQAPEALSVAKPVGGVSWIRWGIGILGPVVTRAAQAYALSAVENLLINNAAVRPPEPTGRADFKGQTSERVARGPVGRN